MFIFDGEEFKMVDTYIHMCSDNLTLKLGCKEPRIAKSDVKRSKLEDLVLLATG